MRSEASLSSRVVREVSHLLEAHGSAGPLAVVNVLIVAPYTALGAIGFLNWEHNALKPFWLLLGLGLWVVAPATAILLACSELLLWAFRKRPFRAGALLALALALPLLGAVVWFVLGMQSH